MSPDPKKVLSSFLLCAFAHQRIGHCKIGGREHIKPLTRSEVDDVCMFGIDTVQVGRGYIPPDLRSQKPL